MDTLGFVHSADADACNVARVSCNVALFPVMLHVFRVMLQVFLVMLQVTRSDARLLCDSRATCYWRQRRDLLSGRRRRRR